MSAFEEILLRLKQRAKLHTDKQVAGLLGISPTAFNDRKKRDTFPVQLLIDVAQRRPELGLDVNYVLTGDTGDSDVVRSDMMLRVMDHFGWRTLDMGGRLGMRKEREEEFIRALHGADVIRLQSREMRWLVQEWGIRRDFLVHGTGPMLSTGETALEVQRLNERVANLEALIAEMRAASLSAPKRSVPSKRSTSTRRPKS